MSSLANESYELTNLRIAGRLLINLADEEPDPDISFAMKQRGESVLWVYKKLTEIFEGEQNNDAD